MPRRATYKCLKCDSRDIVTIVYGYVGEELAEESRLGQVKLGGCGILEDAPDRHCNHCDNQWLKAYNYSPKF